MPATPAAQTDANLTTPDQIEGDAMTALYRASVGEVNTQHYVNLFTRFEAQDRAGLSWNWAAALCTLNWLAYRRLWLAALVYTSVVAAAGLLLFGLGRLMFQLSDMVEIALVFTGVVVAIVVPGLGGNAIFYTQSRDRMDRALRASPTLAEACALLLRRSGSRKRLVILALANAIVMGLVASGVTLFPKARHAPPQEERVPPSTTTPHVTGAVQGAPAAPKEVVPVLEPAPPPTPTPLPAPSAATEVVPPPVVIAPEPTALPTPPRQKPVATPTKKPPAPPKTTGTKAVDVKPARPVAPALAPLASDRFYLNVGLFADDNNALNAHVQLSDAGLPSTQTEVSTPKGRRTRVRVGPFDTLTDADRAAKKIRALGLEAVLVRP